MRLFVLKVIDHDHMPEAYSGWTCAHGHVVVASDEHGARRQAAAIYAEETWWLDATFTSCVEEALDGDARVLLSNLPTG